MKTEFLSQFKSIKEALDNNVSTIGKLVSQAKTLSEIAEKIDGTSCAEKETKEQLQGEIDEIQQSIAALIKQTQMLFDLYERFADELFTGE